MLVDISEDLRADPISRISVGLGKIYDHCPTKSDRYRFFWKGGMAVNCYLINQTLRGRMRGVRAYCSLYPLEFYSEVSESYSRSFGGN